jgi:D-alanyl-lipoteichoic acid acyltransferase DltB (MBOAT superfamily)
VGLFVHNRWANLTRAQAKALDSRPRLKRVAGAISTLVVFHFVALGWVWFALPRIDLSWQVLGGLFGVRP